MTAANSPDNDATALSILRTLVATGARAAVSGADMMEKGLALGISKASGAAKQVMTSATATVSPDLGDVVQRLAAHVHDGVELLFSAVGRAADAFTALTGARAIKGTNETIAHADDNLISSKSATAPSSGAGEDADDSGKQPG